jgi:uncharacterized protein
MIVDVNVSLSRWPFRTLPCDKVPRLVDRLRRHGVTQAWAGTFDGVFHRDVAAANACLAEDCKGLGGLLVPFGSVNPMLPDWREDLRRCHEMHHMPGIRLHPNYHGYAIGEPVFAELLALAEKRGLIVQLAVRLDDVRVQHPLGRVPDVDTTPLAQILTARRGLRLVILNGLATIRGAELGRLAAAGNAYFDIATLEGIAGVEMLLKTVPAQRVLFGSHLPLFHLESVLLKMRESDLPPAQGEAILHGNAQRLMREAAGLKEELQ